MKKEALFICLAVIITASAFMYWSFSEATCTGDKNCNACKNCKYCKHCSKDGGSCGVCK